MCTIFLCFLFRGHVCVLGVEEVGVADHASNANISPNGFFLVTLLSVQLRVLNDSKPIQPYKNAKDVHSDGELSYFRTARPCSSVLSSIHYYVNRHVEAYSTST
uniref:Secreted protein n=1 Tax=Trichuris muris TaxID=70415 RepID=A0A5S6R5Q6_TRIMR